MLGCHLLLFQLGYLVFGQVLGRCFFDAQFVNVLSGVVRYQLVLYGLIQAIADNTNV